MDEAQIADLEKAVKGAHRLVTLALVILVIFVVVTALDERIKRSIIRESGQIRLALDEFKTALVREAGGGTQAGEMGAGGGDLPVSGDGVVHDPSAPAAVVPDANGTPSSARGRAGGKGGRPGGDA